LTVLEPRSDSGAVLDEHSVAPRGEHLRARGRQRHAVFVLFDLFRHTDDHFISS
jgi:hypothetical protein